MKILSKKDAEKDVHCGDRELWENGYHLVFETWTEAVDFKLLLERLKEKGDECDHEWVNAENEVIESGEWCRKCHAIRAKE